MPPQRVTLRLGPAPHLVQAEVSLICKTTTAKILRSLFWGRGLQGGVPKNTKKVRRACRRIQQLCAEPLRAALSGSGCAAPEAALCHRLHGEEMRRKRHGSGLLVDAGRQLGLARAASKPSKSRERCGASQSRCVAVGHTPLPACRGRAAGGAELVTPKD